MADEQETGNLQGVGYKNPPKERQFGQPGGNPRNVRGVPKNALELRRLIKQIGAEYIALPQSERDKLEGKKPQQIRRLHALIKTMYSSRQPSDKAAILKAGWPGILKDELEISGENGGPVQVMVYLPNNGRDDSNTPTTPPGSVPGDPG